MATSRNLDLSSYVDESNLGATTAYVKHNKYTQYLESELAKPSSKRTAEEAQECKRISMAFTDNNYQFILDETSQLGINCAHFLNSLIRIMDTDEVDKYVESQPLRKGNNAIKRKGHPAKRINLKFPMDSYQKMASGAKRTGTTLTQYLNMIIEVYKLDKSD